MPRVPDVMMLAKLQALSEVDKTYILALIDLRVARTIKQTRQLRLVVSRLPVAL